MKSNATLLLFVIIASYVLFTHPANAIQITVHSDTSTLLDFSVDWSTPGDAFEPLSDGLGYVHVWFDPVVDYVLNLEVADYEFSRPFMDWGVFFASDSGYLVAVELNPHATWWDTGPNSYGAKFIYRAVPDGSYALLLFVLGVGSVGALGKLCRVLA